MLKFFYRLKRRRGVVLFAVIAMMTILITMATVAYFTTRTAYQTVVSNYDFSQMYISTTSVSDMIIDSLVEDTSAPNDSGSVNKNYFKDLKDKIKNLVTSGHVGDKLVGVSSNIAWGDRDDYDRILSYGAENSVVPGALDAVKVTITLENKTDTKPDGTPLPTGLNNYYFVIETVGFYRNNTVTVQDYIYETTGTSKASNPPMFDTFFTATSQMLVSGQQKHTDTRFVVINTDEITDNAYFQNKFTVIQGGDRSNVFRGGVRTTGGLYLHKIETNIAAPSAGARHDWIIGGDLVILDANANSIDLNGNNLYVKGNLIIGCSGFTLKAGSVYVEGNIYFGTGTSIDITGDNGTTAKPGVYVNGDIINFTNAADASTVSNNWADGMSAFVSLSGNTVAKTELTISKQFELIGNASRGSAYSPTAGSATISLGSGDLLYQTTGKTNQSGLASESCKEMVWSNLNTKIAQGTENPATGMYEYTVVESAVKDVLDTSETGNLKTYDYANYSTEQAAVDRVLTLDFSKIKDADGREGTSAQVNGTLTCVLGTVGGKDATITFTGNNTVGNLENAAVIDLPYVEGGYRVEYKLANYGGWKTMNIREGRGLTINIHTADGYNADGSKKTENWVTVTNGDGSTSEVIKTMPIVLTPNYDDGSTNDKDGQGFNSFSWRPGSNGTISAADSWTNVQVVGETDSTKAATGNLILEMANYALTNFTDSDGDSHSANDYVEYDPDNYLKIGTAKYIPCGMEKVGTAKQVADSPSITSIKYTSDLSDFLDPGTSNPASGYENKIILVSNMNNPGVCFQSTKNNVLFGLLYAPNAMFSAPASDASCPIFGGMIVSDYVGKQASFVYAQPDPSLVKGLGTLTSKNSPSPTPTDSTSVWSREAGSNYLG